MPSHVQGLPLPERMREFARIVLLTLADPDNREWCSDHLEAIALEAKRFGLAGTDAEGFFAANPEAVEAK